MPSLPISHQRQLRQTECLAACAGMVLDYLQIPHTYPSLVALLQIGSAGAPFRNLHNLEKLNVLVQIEQGEVEDLRSFLERGLPSIVFIKTSELSYWNEANNHAIVFAGMDDKQVFLFDPAFDDAPQIVSVAEFELAWLEMDQFFAVISLK